MRITDHDDILIRLNSRRRYTVDKGNHGSHDTARTKSWVRDPIREPALHIKLIIGRATFASDQEDVATCRLQGGRRLHIEVIAGSTGLRLRLTVRTKSRIQAAIRVEAY